MVFSSSHLYQVHWQVSAIVMSSYYMEEMHVTNNYCNPCEFCFDTSSTWVDIFPLLESLGYICPVSDLSTPHQEDAFCNISSVYERDYVYPAISHFERDLQSYNIWTNWDGEYYSCFANNSYKDDNSLSSTDAVDDYEHCSALEKFQSEEYGDNYLPHYDSWSVCESWFRYLSEEDEKEKTTDSHSGAVDETGLYEGIFGYWPCLMQKQQFIYRD